MRLSAPVKFIIVVVLSYLVLKAPGWAFERPIPGSLVVIYMFFAVVTTLLAMTATDEGAEALFGPIVRLATDPSKRAYRYVVFAVLPIVAGLLTYSWVAPSADVPAELRSVHPAPPSFITAYGRRIDLGRLANPLRETEIEDPEAFRAHVAEGGEIYFRNCFQCHGAKLDGRGHNAHAISPAPLPFTGQDTIAQLRESYVFWRIVKGGRGLPREGGPWSSAMPAWEETLTEDEVWKVVLFLYDFTGTRPRTWEKEP